MLQTLFVSYDDSEFGKELEKKNRILGEMLNSEQLEGAAATKEMVKQKMSGEYSVVHIHAHGAKVGEYSIATVPFAIIIIGP